MLNLIFAAVWANILMVTNSFNESCFSLSRIVPRVLSSFGLETFHCKLFFGSV